MLRTREYKIYNTSIINDRVAGRQRGLFVFKWVIGAAAIIQACVFVSCGLAGEPGEYSGKSAQASLPMPQSDTPWVSVGQAVTDQQNVLMADRSEGGSAWISQLIEKLHNENPWVQELAARLLVAQGERAVGEVALILSNPMESFQVRELSAHILGQIGGSKATEALLDTLTDQGDRSGIRTLVVTVLANIYTNEDPEVILSGLNDPEARSAAQGIVEAFGIFGNDNMVSLMRSNPDSFRNLLEAIDSGRAGELRELIGIVGQDTVYSMLRNEGGRLENLLSNISNYIGGMDEFKEEYAKLQGVFGEEGVREAFVDDACNLTEMIVDIDTLGWDNFLEIKGQFAAGTLEGIFNEDPGKISNAVGVLSKIGIDNYKDSIRYLKDTFGEGVFTELFSDDFCGLTVLLSNISGSLTYEDYYTTTSDLRQFKGVVDQMVRTIGKDALLRIFASSPTQFIERLTGLSVLMGSDSWNTWVGKFGKDAIVGLFTQDSGLTYVSNRVSFEALEEIITNRLENAPDGRPLAVLIYPKADSVYTPGFTEDPLISDLIQQGYRIMYYEADTDAEAIGYINDATSTEKASFILIGGHGNSDSITFGGVPASFTASSLYDLRLDYSDSAMLLSAGVQNRLVEGGTVVLLSCSTGAGECGAENMGNMIRSVFTGAAHVFAPVVDTTVGLKLSFDNSGMVVAVSKEEFFDFATCPIP